MTPASPSDLPPPRNPWTAFRRRHLLQYPAPALAAWLLITGCGLLALSWASWRTVMLPATSVGPVLLALGLVALATRFDLKLPRSAYTVSAADVFVFSALASLGTPVAVLAVGIEAVVSTRRAAQPLGTRLSSPAASMAAMAVCGAVFEAAKAGLEWTGQTPEVAMLVALCGVALLQFALTMVPLMAMFSLKRGLPQRPLDWFADATWLAALCLGTSFVAGLVHLNAQRFGPSVLVASGALMLGLVALLRLHFRRQEADRTVKEAQLAEAQREAILNQQRFSAAFSHAAIGMAIVQPGGSILQVNEAFCALLGRAPATLVGQPFCGTLRADDMELLRREVQAVAAQPDDAVAIELRVRGPDGNDLWVSVHCSRYDDPGGNGPCLIYQLHDITSRHQAESQLHYFAFHDDLTGLANRHGFNERLEVAVEKSRLNAEQRFAVLFLDLDRFKIVNDSLGQMAGNQLLREVAQRLGTCVRPNDLVARLGGDEFAILLEDLHDPEWGQRVAQRVLEALSLPLAINGVEVVLGASVGITFSDLGYRMGDEVLRDADLAMYEAKAGGRGRVALFDGTMHEKVAQKLALEGELRRAISEGQLSVHYQPLYELTPYRLIGFEALARWDHPQRGPVSPGVFITLAEESGHIGALTDWMIDHAVAQLALWQRTVPGGAQLSMHINISGRDLGRSSLVTQVQQVLLRQRPSPGTLTLEITETTLMGRLDAALPTMRALRDKGVGFSIDDFGTGYSSLAYLGTLPIDSLKIDRSFVMGLHDQPQNVEIVRAVLNLGLSLGRKVIAEGIETTEQLAALRELGVPVGQGYLLSRPLRAEQATALMAAGVGASAATRLST
jgi:diguanylate cyclase (GGDEF)-like protein/PAS domain S-box-containing protein